MDELDEIAKGAETWVDAVVVGDVVTVVAVRCRVHRVEPQACHTETGEVVEAAGQSDEVSDAVTVGVLKGLDVKAIDDGLLEPVIFHVRATLRPGADRSDVPRMCDGCHQPYPRTERLRLGLLVEGAVRTMVTFDRGEQVVGPRSDRASVCCDFTPVRPR